MNTDIIIIQNYWQTPYKILLFNAMYKIFPYFKVFYLAEIDKTREWKLNREQLSFCYDVFFQGFIEDINPIKAALAIHKALDVYDPKVVIIGGYNYFFYWAAFLWAKRNGKRIILINESHSLDKQRSKIKEACKRLLVSNCDAALVDGTRHRDYTISLGMESEKIFIKQGPGPVDVPYYQRKVTCLRSNRFEICEKIGIPKRNFLFVGRLSKEKNILFLIRAYQKLKREGAKDWGLILVGNGPLRGPIDNFITKNEVRDILIPGFKQQDELPFFYSISDVFILPSVSEPWGLVVNEAMASGLPILASNRCGCYPDIVHDARNGFSFDPYKEDELFALMKSIVNGNFNLDAMGKWSLEIIRDFTLESAGQMYLKAINYVLGK